MSSVGSRAEFPNRVYSPSPEDDFEDPELRPLHPRRPSSYEEMNRPDDGYTKEGQLHQYEDPRLVAEQIRRMKNPPPFHHEIRPRKKANDLYETSRSRTDSDGSESSTRSPRCAGLMCFLVPISLLIASAALAMVILLTLGEVVPKSCESCDKKVHLPQNIPHAGSSGTPNVYHLERMIKILQANLTHLHQIVRRRDEVIKNLVETGKSHTEQINLLFRNQLSDILRNAKYNVTARLKKELRGKRGPRGPKGERGPPGVKGEPGSGNISTCIYKVKKIEFSPSSSFGHDVFVTQPKGWLIISATCSSEGSSESSLRRLQGPSGLRYGCRCKGISVGNNSGTATCYIHYWQCPKL